MIKKITNMFPIWAILFAIIALLSPEFISGYKSLIIPLLVLIMFLMGITLTLDDFIRVLKSPTIIFVGVLLQYLIMPAAAFIISKIYGLDDELLVGMVLVGSVAGGTASNVICYLAGGDVALSVTMTTVSTLLAFILTPLITSFYAGEYIPVPILDMLFSILKIVLLPTLCGVLVNRYFAKNVAKFKDYLPLISMLAIVLIISIVVSLNSALLLTIGGTLIIAVVSHNLVGLILGYYISLLLGYNKKVCITISIEVSMQNSGLAVALATKYFPALSALPGAIFSIWHNISGSLIACYWSTKNLNGK
ncbi:MAG: bile acid:sodium symporter family protein [Bacteroidetes bacterium]|nr:bile acid:sodium symporter family protein [Bacteroidota bacterium]MBU1113502.1 bile acid:sodium symporter family protein [Bacteroidota bacterium]MBU1797393.1 bile acid:sodium symporter family protein [Bacteroidota bacterium]